MEVLPDFRVDRRVGAAGPLLIAGAACLVLLVVFTHPVLAGEGGASGGIAFGGGSPKGVYQKIAVEVGERFEGRESSVRPVQSSGSWDNLEKLDRGRLDFALAQQDAVGRFLSRHSDSSIRVVDRIYVEFLHILVRHPLEMDRLETLRGLKLWPGNPGSGSRFTAQNLLDRSQLSMADYEVVDREISTSDLERAFREREVDVAMAVSAGGTEWIGEGISEGLYRLVPLHYDSLRALTEIDRTEQRAQLFISEIPSAAYESRADAVTSVAIPVLLLTRAGTAPATVRAVRRATDEGYQVVRERRDLSPAPSGLPLLSESQLPLVDSYESRRFHPVTLRRLFFGLGLIVLAGAAGLCGWWRRDWVFDRVRTHRMKATLLAFGGIALVSTVVVHLVEHDINPHFATLSKSAWSMMVYLISGFASRGPYTQVGRVFATVTMALAPALLAVIAGYVASNLLLEYLEGKMPSNLTDHIVILNWNDRAIHIVRELRTEILKLGDLYAPIVIIGGDSNTEVQEFKTKYGLSEDEEMRDVYFSPGDPTSESVLRRANILDSRAVLILSDEESSMSSDEHVLQSVFALQRIADGAGVEADDGLHVVIELQNTSNSTMIEEIDKNFPGVIEASSRDELGTLLVAQAVHIPKLTELYRNLMTFTDDSNEFYALEIPPSASGMSFPEYASEALAHRPDYPIIPVGVKRWENGQPTLRVNPQPDDAFYELREGDELVLISYDPPEGRELPDIDASA